MNPRFALNLGHDSVSLLGRVPDGWSELGRAGFDDPDLERTLADLRAQAEAMAPEGFTTKLILPASQILYTEVETQGSDTANCRERIAAALEGRTPYPVAELVFDWSGDGPEVQVAVVARLTLDEAEDFAATHGFNPVSFVTVPEPGQFAGEPFFGTTRAAAELLPDGDRPARDGKPVRIIPLPEITAEPAQEAEAGKSDAPGPEGDEVLDDAEAGEPPAEADAEKGAADAAGDADRAETEEEAPADDASDAVEAEDVLAADEADPDETETEATANDASDEAEDEDVLAADADHDGTEPDTPADDAPDEVEVEDVLAADDADRDETEAEAPAADAQDEVEDAGVLAAEIIDDAGGEEEEVALAVAAPNITAGALPDDGDLPEAAADRAAKPEEDLPGDFAASLGPEPDAAEAPFIAVEDLPDLEGADAAPAGPAAQLSRIRFHLAEASDPDPRLIARRSEAAADGHGVTAPGLAVPQNHAARSGSAPAATAAPAARRARNALGPAKPAPGAAADEGRAFGVWSGDRAPSTARLRIGIILAAAALILITAIALWSLWFGSGGETLGAAPAPATTTETAGLAEVPPPQVPAEADAPTPSLDAGTAEADLAPELAATAPTEDPAETTEPAGIAAPFPVADGTAEPKAVPEPAADAPGAPAIAETAPGPDVAPATPLAAPDTTTADTAPALQPLPPPFGTEYDLMPDGSIRPTEDGVVTPGGFTLVAGKPPQTPASRPEAVAAAFAARDADAAAAAPEAEAATGAIDAPLPAPVDPAHAARKPRAVPEAVIARAAETEAAAQAEAKALASASRLAVASSQRPAEKPSGFAKAVDAAIASAVAESVATAPPPAPELVAAPEPVAAPAPAAPEPAATASTEEIDEPEPVEAVPNMPTSVTVARQATVKNAINLKDMNLIGVYGSSASRRALVRMPNGRYIKVKVGDRLDGGQVAAIGDSELAYVKKGKTHVLKILKGG
ncbi:hypothetical protein OEZ60_13690 [Defluviimonas sp. WL0024]|uniref:Type IV pilus biogenesis protein PilP n=1 Tax=Albidovulum salinarum TaxID=2984153 RepID=A0ABT2XBH3_9RHOB|nr:hypothetical protein [Defluviimonas sp. WL0024]MCU9849055.1 hypothetical protein [Defluviimonas sp. WL0024]